MSLNPLLGFALNWIFIGLWLFWCAEWMFEHSTDDEFRHVYKNILLQSKTSITRTNFRQENCYINSNEIEWNTLGMLRHAQPHPKKLCLTIAWLAITYSLINYSFHIYLTTCKKLTSYLKWFLRYKSLWILKSD